MGSYIGRSQPPPVNGDDWNRGKPSFHRTKGASPLPHLALQDYIPGASAPTEWARPGGEAQGKEHLESLGVRLNRHSGLQDCSPSPRRSSGSEQALFLANVIHGGRPLQALQVRGEASPTSPKQSLKAAVSHAPDAGLHQVLGLHQGAHHLGVDGPQAQGHLAQGALLHPGEDLAWRDATLVYLHRPSL